MAEVWELIEGTGQRDPLSFSQAQRRASGSSGTLRASSDATSRRTRVFPTPSRFETFVASTIDRAHLAPLVPELSEPFHATARHVIFVAEKAA